MRDQKTTDTFEARLADLIRTYTDEAAERPIDPVAVSRTAMASGRSTGWSTRGMGARGSVVSMAAAGPPLRWRSSVGVVGIAVWSRPSNSGIGPAPAPSPSSSPSPQASAVGPSPTSFVTSGSDRCPSRLARISDRAPRPDGCAPRRGFQPDTALHSAVAAAGPDTLVATATAETTGCAVGDLGVYRWSLEGTDTFLTLTAVGADECAAREMALAGPWVRADLPSPSEGETLPPR